MITALISMLASVVSPALTIDNSMDRVGTVGLEYRSGQNPTEILISDTSHRRAGKEVTLEQSIESGETSSIWTISITNGSNAPVTTGNLWIYLPFAETDEELPAKENICSHSSIGGNASFAYWNRYSDNAGLLMTPLGASSLEYEDEGGRMYIHAKWAADPDDKWRFPLTEVSIAPGQVLKYSFAFDNFESYPEITTRIMENGGLVARFAPGMVIPASSEVLCAVRTKERISSVTSESPAGTSITDKGTAASGSRIYSLRFDTKGENMITIEYGEGRKAYLNFFVTEKLGEIMKLRSSFIVEKQQHRNKGKWYDGLYSVWDMKERKLLSPEDRQLLPAFVVGGSDDPSNSKPIYVSEKNVWWPDAGEVASLEYYEDNFVAGKLQRSADESPFPYGIYGSNNWFENRSGKAGDYGSGGLGLERMWRTFDYTTHFAICYNLYLISSGNPALTSHTPDYWLDLAYNTAKAYFHIPYNIKMGEMWNFHGWCDWAYKQGNFHERYLLDIIAALEEEGLEDRAAELRAEWEKKVMYFVYEDPWPFGSEMFVDRTAFESSYYVADYGMSNDIVPQKNMWQDKNSLKWYSYDRYDRADAARLMSEQITSNLAIRGILGQSYWNCGTAWQDLKNVLCYMGQMGGTAILDYAVKYSDDPATFVNYGYNSMLSSWALVNTGYWNESVENIGAAGWTFSKVQRGHTYFGKIPASWGPWRYCGEIDHGFTGGVHGMGTYMVNDKDFGLYVYGGELKQSSGKYRVYCDEASAGRFFVTAPFTFGVEFRQDAIDSSRPVTMSRDGKVIKFRISNRYGCRHCCDMKLHLPENGEYIIRSNGRKLDNGSELSFCLGKKGCRITIRKK